VQSEQVKERMQMTLLLIIIAFITATGSLPHLAYYIYRKKLDQRFSSLAWLSSLSIFLTIILKSVFFFAMSDYFKHEAGLVLLKITNFCRRSSSTESEVRTESLEFMPSPKVINPNLLF
jgi:hypothetical protein